MSSRAGGSSSLGQCLLGWRWPISHVWLVTPPALCLVSPKNLGSWQYQRSCVSECSVRTRRYLPQQSKLMTRSSHSISPPHPISTIQGRDSSPQILLNYNKRCYFCLVLILVYLLIEIEGPNDYSFNYFVSFNSIGNNSLAGYWPSYYDCCLIIVPVVHQWT